MVGPILKLKKKWLGLLLLGLAIAGGCATMQPVDSGKPHKGPPYPVVQSSNEQRIQAVQTAWNRILSMQKVSKTEIPLQPVTQTIRSLPANLSGSIYLPKVGLGPQQNEEEAIESLRRFLNDWQVVLGTMPGQLSLKQLDTDANGNRTAIYEQRPFSFPLRGNYGTVLVRFTADRRLTEVSSTAVPDAERVQTAINAASQGLKSEDITKTLKGRSFNFNDSAGNPQSYSLGPNSQLTVKQLVVYARLLINTEAVEFRLAWEVNPANAPVNTIYVDALNGEIIAAS